MPKLGRRGPAQRVRRREHVHVEAYPVLNVHDARKQVMADHQRVLWMDQRGRVRGAGFAVLDGHELRLMWHLRTYDEENDVTRSKRFRLEVVKGALGQVRYFTRCPVCEERVRDLAVVEDIWACSSCQGLTWRSDLIGSVGRKSEKIIKLEEQLANGRPKGMRSSTYDRLVETLEDLKLEVGTPMVSSSAYATVITAWWQREGPLLMNGGALVMDAPSSGDWE